MLEAQRISEEMFEFYVDQKWDQCLAKLDELSVLFHTHGHEGELSVETLRKRVKKYVENGIPEGWNGTEALDAK
jgi:hypothetical protein